jgi:hypothetical protein
MATTKQPAPSSKPQLAPAIPSVTSATETIAALEAQRKALLAESERDNAEMRRVSYAAHVAHELEAVGSLREITGRGIEREARLRSLDCALVTARTVLGEAQASEAREQDRSKALALHKMVREIDEALKYADKHLALAITALNAVNVGIDEIHKAGSDFPTHMQMAANAERALKTVIMQLPRQWWRDFGQHLAPPDRRTFGEFWARMRVPLENGIRQRLGEAEQPSKEAAA